ncbi:MAG: HEAT repeat domain-containing protein [Acidobacteria bacterium]|nr:HEAT repeat domain-containing protein [Acidobacteriota bacterium]MBI3654907.1 HEAT repeat domain-containing protein [Acidobacteriota bacterium]
MPKRNQGSTIRSQSASVRRCLEALAQADMDRLYDILPELGVHRHEDFLPPLFALLNHTDRRKQEFAAHALGAVGDPKALVPIQQKLTDPQTSKGPGCESLQTALIDALGEIGEDAGVVILKSLLDRKADPFASRRQELVVEALGMIAQQGGNKALNLLVDLLSAKTPALQLTSITEISVAFWHRPNEIPGHVFSQLVALSTSRNAAVRVTAIAELETLANLGCAKAKSLLFSDS